MKILITGATGFVGQHLIKTLSKKDIKTFALVRKDSDISAIDKYSNILEYDENINTLIKIFEKYNFDGVVHLASLFLSNHVNEDIKNIISSNILFGTQLLEASKQQKLKWFINTGTFWQHYNNEKYNPVNLYAASKQAFEDIAKYYIETSDIVFTTLKLNDTFGENDKRKKIFNFWNEISINNKSLEMSLGEQIMDILYIDDVISAFIILIEGLSSFESKSFKNKSFCITSNEKMKLKDLSKVFENATNRKLKIEWGKLNYRQREVMKPCDNLPILPKWKQKFSLMEAIKKCYG